MLFIYLIMSCSKIIPHKELNKGLIVEKQRKIIDSLEDKELYNFFKDIFGKDISLYDKDDNNLLKLIISNDKISNDFKEKLFFMFTINMITIRESNDGNEYEKKLSNIKKELNVFLNILNEIDVLNLNELEQKFKNEHNLLLDKIKIIKDEIDREKEEPESIEDGLVDIRGELPKARNRIKDNLNNIHTKLIKSRIESIFSEERIDYIFNLKTNKENSLLIQTESETRIDSDSKKQITRSTLKDNMIYFEDIVFCSIKAGLKKVSSFLINLYEYNTIRKDNMTPLGYCITSNSSFFDEFSSLAYELKYTNKFLEGSLEEKISSPLAIAVALNKKDIVKKLLLLGVNPDGKDDKGNKAILIASNKAYRDIVDILIVSNGSYLTNGPILAKKLKKGFQSILGSIVASGITLGTPIPENTLKALNLTFTPGIVNLIKNAGEQHTFGHTDEYSKIREIFKEGNWVKLIHNKMKNTNKMEKEQLDNILVLISILVPSMKEDILNEFDVIPATKSFIPGFFTKMYKNPEVKNVEKSRKNNLYNMIVKFEESVKSDNEKIELEEIKKMKKEIDLTLELVQENLIFEDNHYINISRDKEIIEKDIKFIMLNLEKLKENRSSIALLISNSIEEGIDELEDKEKYVSICRKITILEDKLDNKEKKFKQFQEYIDNILIDKFDKIKNQLYRISKILSLRQKITSKMKSIKINQNKNNSLL